MFVLCKMYPSGLKPLWCVSNITIQKILKVSVSDDIYYRHKYSKELEAAVNKQIQAEQQAAQEYLNLAVTLLHPSISRPGSGSFFMSMYHEELEHMEGLINYQLHRGAMPMVQGVTAPTTKPKITLIEAFRQALDMERCITELIEQLILTAEKDKDHNCVNFVTTVFLNEQMNAIHTLSHHVTNIASISNNIDALYQYDLHLHNTYKKIHKSETK